eukprot:GHRR01026440.1.p1 GENE.GHRR01026440.1~~GHRR01026440.1.p1  ORF type:complete len:156 (-),score=27.99 GHRR01026440.1:603-1070(-)
MRLHNCTQSSLSQLMAPAELMVPAGPCTVLLPACAIGSIGPQPQTATTHPEVMCVAGDEYVHTHLPLQNSERLLVPPGHYLVAMTHTNLEVRYLHNLQQRTVPGSAHTHSTSAWRTSKQQQCTCTTELRCVTARHHNTATVRCRWLASWTSTKVD